MSTVSNKLSVICEADTVRVNKTGRKPDPLVTEKPKPITSTFALVGEVADTHHPDLKGHVFVSWRNDEGKITERWLQCVGHVAPRKGDRVLLEKPLNWPELLVSAIVEGVAGSPSEGMREGDSKVLELQQNERVRVVDAQGKALVDIFATSQGPTIQFLNQDMSLDVRGKLRLSAEAIELEGGRGGVDIRTEADAVVRGRFIRLN
jgi:hypothetical protein